jgi:hypothetical protein
MVTAKMLQEGDWAGLARIAREFVEAARRAREKS